MHAICDCAQEWGLEVDHQFSLKFSGNAPGVRDDERRFANSSLKV